MHEAIENKDIEIIKLIMTKNDIGVNCFSYLKNEIINIDIFNKDGSIDHDFDEV